MKNLWQYGRRWAVSAWLLAGLVISVTTFGRAGETTPAAAKGDKKMEQAMFGAGCFWGVEDILRNTKGVVDTAVGYSGGTVANPTYEQVCTHQTGHAEVVYLTFDPTVISYKELLAVFWHLHDPTQVNRQGPDVGSNYRSVIYTYGEEQQKTAEASKAELAASGQFKRPIATTIQPAGPFYRGEAYHQQYLQKNGLSNCHLK